MAQTGFTPISLYYTATAAATPTAGNLVAGELAINTNDGKLFYKDSSGVVQTIATKASAALGGSTTGTGALVLQTSPTLVTPALGTPSAINLTNATALPSAALPAGSVIQVVQGTYSTEVSTTSNSYVTTGITATITPKFATSKILIISSVIAANQGTGKSAFFTIYRNSTNLASNTYNNFGQTYFGNSTSYTNTNMTYLDSPATTSATTYTVYMNAYINQTLVANVNGGTGTIQLLEIAS